MGSWPPVPGRRAINLDLADRLIEHADRMAAYFGMSRTAYIRQLIVHDIERQDAMRQDAMRHDAARPPRPAA